ncbi:MAG: hypothetical protein NTW21_43115 [Verrucomicrobia bacterium]|nr:hypothetical protein [Verrucomicrobiota bacterium]
MKTLTLTIVTLGLAGPMICQAAPPTVNHEGGAKNISTGTAQLCGTLAGEAATEVTICWGPTDGGTDKTKWAQAIPLQGVPSGAFSATAKDLIYGETYYYRCAATNASGTAWAPAATKFTSQQPQRPADLPVSKGLALRLDASQLTGVTDGQQMETWQDVSGQANHALRQNYSSAGFPRYAANQLNGLPVVQFDSGASMGDAFQFKRISNIRTVFWVLKENAGVSGNHFLMGDSIAYHFHRNRGNGPMWEPIHSRPEIRKGITKLMGTAVDGTKTALPAAQYQLLSLVTAGNVQADQITQDRHFAGSWQGDIAEILIYTEPLSTQDEATVGGYLATKYGLKTAYPAVPAVVSTSTLDNAPVSEATATSVVLHAKLACPGAMYSVRACWGTEDGGTDPARWTHTAEVGQWSNVPSVAINKTVTGFKPNTTYYYTFRAANGADDIWAANVMSFGPSPANTIRTFGTATLKHAVISGANITWTVPFPAEVTALAPSYTLPPGASGKPASGTTRDFTKPQTYSVTAENGATKVHTVTIVREAPRTGKNILTFGIFPRCPALIFGTHLTLTVPHHTDLAKMAPTLTLAPGATCKPASGTAGDFTKPQVYVVAAEDGSTTNYTVTAAKSVPPAADILSFGLPGKPAVIAGTAITWTVPQGTDVTALAPVFLMSDLATGYPYPGTPRNFTTPQSYTITADDGTTKNYVVTVVQENL